MHIIQALLHHTGPGGYSEATVDCWNGERDSNGNRPRAWLRSNGPPVQCRGCGQTLTLVTRLEVEERWAEVPLTEDELTEVDLGEWSFEKDENPEHDPGPSTVDIKTPRGTVTVGLLKTLFPLPPLRTP